MLKLVICDLDGTLLPQGKQSIPRDTLAAIKHLTDTGVLFAVASGRPYSQLKPLFGALYRRIIFICLDGALVMHRDCVIYKNRLCKIEAARLISLCDKATVYGRTTQLQFDQNTPYRRRSEMLNRLGSEVFKVAVYGTPLKSAAARLCYDRGGICEYVAHSADKGVAAKAVMDKFGVLHADTVAIGDGENDVALLRAVATPLRMQQSAPALCEMGVPIVYDIAKTLAEL